MTLLTLGLTGIAIFLVLWVYLEAKAASLDQKDPSRVHRREAELLLHRQYHTAQVQKHLEAIQASHAPDAATAPAPAPVLPEPRVVLHCRHPLADGEAPTLINDLFPGQEDALGVYIGRYYCSPSCALQALMG